MPDVLLHFTSRARAHARTRTFYRRLKLVAEQNVAVLQVVARAVLAAWIVDGIVVDPAVGVIVAAVTQLGRARVDRGVFIVGIVARRVAVTVGVACLTTLATDPGLKPGMARPHPTFHPQVLFRRPGAASTRNRGRALRLSRPATTTSLESSERG